MATVRELAAAYFAAEDKLQSTVTQLARLQQQRTDLVTQITAAQVERDQAQTELIAAKRALKDAL